jgi:hypothetical protein
VTLDARDMQWDRSNSLKERRGAEREGWQRRGEDKRGSVRGKSDRDEV